MITYRRQCELLKEIKEEPSIKKQTRKRDILTWINLIVLLGGLSVFLCVLFGDLMRSGKKQSVKVITIEGISFAVMIAAMIFGNFINGLTQKIRAEIKEKLDAKIIADANETDAKGELSDKEKLAYYQEKHQKEDEEIAIVKKYYSFCWAKCAIPLVLAVVALFFMPLKVLGGLGGETSLFECVKDFIKGFGAKKEEEKFVNTLLGSFIGGDSVSFGKMMLRLYTFLFFIAAAVSFIGNMIKGIYRIYRAQRLVEKTVRVKDKLIVNIVYAEYFHRAYSSPNWNIIRLVLGTAFKGVALLAFPIMFADYLYANDNLLIVVSVILLLLDTGLHAAKMWYAYQNKEDLQVLLPLFEKDSTFLI